MEIKWAKPILFFESHNLSYAHTEVKGKLSEGLSPSLFSVLSNPKIEYNRVIFPALGILCMEVRAEKHTISEMAGRGFALTSKPQKL